MSRKYPGQASITVSLTSLEEYSISEYQATFTILKPSSDRGNLKLHNEETDIEEDEEFLEYSEVTETELTNHCDPSPGPGWPGRQRKIREGFRNIVSAVFVDSVE